jgi:hypothetical protein
MTTQTQTATETQLTTIRRRAYDDTARALAVSGVVLTHEQADDLGDEAMDWLRTRLGLRIEETAAGVECLGAYQATVRSDRYRELCAQLSSLDDGTGNLGTVVAQALMDDPAATADDIRAILAE